MSDDSGQMRTLHRVLGGELGGEGLRVFDQAAFAIGDEVLLFIETRPRDGTLYTSALWQGKWVIAQDTAGGDRSVVCYSPDALQRGTFKGEPERLALAPMAGRVRAKLAGRSSRCGASFQPAPPYEELASD